MVTSKCSETFLIICNSAKLHVHVAVYSYRSVIQAVYSVHVVTFIFWVLGTNYYYLTQREGLETHSLKYTFIEMYIFMYMCTCMFSLVCTCILCICNIKTKDYMYMYRVSWVRIPPEATLIFHFSIASGVFLSFFLSFFLHL